MKYTRIYATTESYRWNGVIQAYYTTEDETGETSMVVWRCKHNGHIHRDDAMKCAQKELKKRTEK